MITMHCSKIFQVEDYNNVHVQLKAIIITIEEGNGYKIGCDTEGHLHLDLTV